MIWHIRTDFGSKLVKSSKRRTKMTHVMIFLFGWWVLKTFPANKIIDFELNLNADIFYH